MQERQNDPKRFIKADHSTRDGEVADKTTYYIDETVIREEAQYDGFYAVCTNLEDDAQAIVKINKRRWKIEECFRIMKREFEARPIRFWTAKHSLLPLILAPFGSCERILFFSLV